MKGPRSGAALLSAPNSPAPPPPNTRTPPRQQEWGALLRRFLRSEDDQVELLLTLEEYCAAEGAFEGPGEGGAPFAAIFSQARGPPARCALRCTRLGGAFGVCVLGARWGRRLGGESC